MYLYTIPKQTLDCAIVHSSDTLHIYLNDTMYNNYAQLRN
jgi:hypothetical protein